MSAGATDRPRIYQLLVRTFGNKNVNRKPYGTIEENGCGKFADIDDTVLRSLEEMGFTHLWLTGVLEQASTTAYPDRPADHPALVKGKAGSPYAIRDCFDVSPDYALDPANRLDEFDALVSRCHRHGFRVLIDFVPNHVARSYASDVRPDFNFGTDDDKSEFFHRDNHFFYLQESHPGGGPPLVLPQTAEGTPYEEWHGRVSGNNVVHWRPGLYDWYETAKINYGHDFTMGRDTRHLPQSDAALELVPRTWRWMDEVICWWQDRGVDGFRVDMAHLVPMEFWRWLLRRARERKEDVYFMAEAYDNDPAKLTDEHVLDALLGAGFDAVYDDPVYDLLMGLYDEGKWCNDLDALTFTGARFHRSLRYGENHDEVRLAHPREWGGLGMGIGRPVCAALFAMGRGPLMVYHGQEVGETAEGDFGYAGDNARTTIFDYGSLPSLEAWLNGGRCDGGGLTYEQRELREWYGRLLRLMGQPAFEHGEFYGLNFANRENPHFGRIEGETVSGHWLYAFLRHDSDSGQVFLVAVNFHPRQVMREVKVIIPRDAMNAWFTVDHYLGRERLQGVEMHRYSSDARINPGWSLPDIAPLSAIMVEIFCDEF
jgi:glycosidase